MDYPGQNIAHGSITVLIATVITTKLLAQFELSTTFYGILYMTLIQTVDYLKNLLTDKDVQLNIKEYLYYLYNYEGYYAYGVILVPLFIFIQICRNDDISVWFSQFLNTFHTEKKYKELTLYDINKTMDIATYMNRYPDYFKGYDEVNRSDSTILQSLMGNVFKTSETSRWLTRLNGTTVPVVNQKIMIDDKKYGVTGFITWYDNQLCTTEYGIAKDDKTVHKVNFKCVRIVLDVDSPAYIEKYIEDISRAVNKEINESFIAAKLMSCETYDYDMATKTIGYMKDYEIEEMEKVFIDTFFHSEKGTLWKYLKKIKLDPNYFYKFGQVPQMNLLLHGPPGTGKSSFSYRVARTLGRNIVTVDLRLIKKKAMLYSIMEKPVIEGRYYSPSQVVYVFDEFDMTVKYLHAQQVKKNNEEKMWKNRVEGYYNSYGSAASIYTGGFGKGNQNNQNNKFGNDIKGKNTEISEESESLESESESESDSESDPDEDSEDESEEDDWTPKKKSKKSKKSVKKKKKSKKKGAEKGLNYSIPDNISLQDLLEVLQGPVPVEQRIIIATTNDYEGIKDLCPALFRSGRLTPILFDNPSRQIIKEITEYYFKKELDITIPEKINAPTSEIIDLCLKSHTFDNPYEFFTMNLKKIISSTSSKKK